MLVTVFVDAAGVAALARAAAAAVDEHLWRELDLGPRVLAQDVQAVAERARGAVGPA